MLLNDSCDSITKLAIAANLGTLSLMDAVSEFKPGDKALLFACSMWPALLEIASNADWMYLDDYPDAFYAQRPT